MTHRSSVCFQRLMLIILFTVFTFQHVYSQQITVKGKVTEVKTGSPIPFANVYVKGTKIGTTTDFDGEYVLTLSTANDSIVASYIGYISRSKQITTNSKLIINFQLDEDVVNLQDVVVTSKRKWKKKENPAYPIMRGILANKEKNDKRSLTAYEYEGYTKIELDIDNMSEKFRSRKIVKKVTQVLDSIDQIAGEDGRPVLPFFISEAISNIYYKSDPFLKHEKVLKTKITGVGIEDGSLTSQVIGGTFQDYNFYQNWLNILSKEFVSPIAESWSLYYDIALVDSMDVEEHYCYRIDFTPKRAQDLAFYGTMWITKEDYALKRIDATIDKGANLNYIEKIKVQQNFTKTIAGPWIPKKTRIVADVSQLTKTSAGLLAKFYISADSIIINKPYPDAFYEIPILKAEKTSASNEYWKAHRHDTLSATEESVYRMIDTLRNIPIIKTTTDLGKLAVTGYYPIGKFDIGSYSSFFGNNNIEGIRIGIGGRTNIKFSDKIVLEGFLAYGELDKRIKYNTSFEYIFNKTPWKSIKLKSKRDIDAIWLVGNTYDNPLLTTVSRFGEITQPFLTTLNQGIYETQLFKGFSQRFKLTHQTFEPQFNFRYRNPNDLDRTATTFSTSEITLESRYARDEVIFINDNSRMNAGTSRWPVFVLSYTLGTRGILGGDFDYHKINFRASKKQKIGTFGVSDIRIEAGHVINSLPYPLLYNTIGNESRFFTSIAFNLLDFFEFSSSTFGSLRYEHSFEGLILNRVPLIKKLKWRLTGSFNAIAGATDEQSIALTQIEGQENGFETLNNQPYMEIGYGIKNILKIIRVDAFHRLTQLDRPGVEKFTVKVGLAIGL